MADGAVPERRGLARHAPARPGLVCPGPVLLGLVRPGLARAWSGPAIGSRVLTSKPPSGPAVAEKLPPTAAARSAIPVSPWPVGWSPSSAAGPSPSSLTRMARAPGS